MRYVPLFMLKTCRVFSHLNGASLAVFESTGRSGLSLDLYFLLVVVIKYIVPVCMAIILISSIIGYV